MDPISPKPSTETPSAAASAAAAPVAAAPAAPVAAAPVAPAEPPNPTRRLLLTDFQFADEKGLTTFLNEREATREIVTGIWYDYEDENTKKPTANVYEYQPLGFKVPPPTQPLSVVRVTVPWDEFSEQNADDFQFITRALVILGDKPVDVALLRKLEHPFPKPGVWEPSPEAKPLVKTIIDIASASEIANHSWKGQGRAPIGYTKGMALVFARAYYKLKIGHAVAKEMAKTSIGDPAKDALAFFDQQLSGAGLPKDPDESSTLRRLFTVLIGLAMPESSGRYWIGLDENAPANANGEECEAGLFQTSWNARGAGGNSTAKNLMVELFGQYKAKPENGMLAIFKEGVFKDGRERISANWGTGDGVLFQQLSKTCPAFAAEFTAVGLRNVRTHWGTIRDGKVEIQAKCDTLLKAVQDAVDKSPNIAV